MVWHDTTEFGDTTTSISLSLSIPRKPEFSTSPGLALLNPGPTQLQTPTFLTPPSFSSTLGYIYQLTAKFYRTNKAGKGRVGALEHVAGGATASIIGGGVVLLGTGSSARFE